MALADRIQEFLLRLTPPTRFSLLTELERLETCDSEVPGSAEVLAKLRSEFRKDGSPQNRVNQPLRYFFAPLESLLIDGAPEHANSGRIQRGSLASIWEWIIRDLLPTMARDYVKKIDELVAANNEREARRVAAAFQTKVIKSLENTLSSSGGADQIRNKLATYTASRAAYGDLTKMLCVLHARDALAKFNNTLPLKIEKFDDERLAKITALLDEFGKSHAEALPFALALVAKRLKTPWQLIRLATNAAPSRNAADIAAAPYAITVSMVLDRLDDKRLALRIALKNNRFLVAREILIEIYDIEYALQSSIDLLDESAWGERLRTLMHAIAALVEAEVSRFPDKIGHVLSSRSLRHHQSLMGRVIHFAWKGRNAVRDGAAYCKKLIGEPETSSS
jgi:flagellin-specific chaperone FliS